MTLVYKATAPIWFPDEWSGYLAYAEGDLVPDANVTAYGYVALDLVEQVTAAAPTTPPLAQSHATDAEVAVAIATRIAKGELYVNVADYGVTEAGTAAANKTAADLAYAAAPAAGGAVYWPAGSYNCNPLAPITKTTRTFGAGAGWSGAQITRIICQSATGHLFTADAHGSHFADLHLYNSAGTVTDGSAIHVTSGNGTRFIDCFITGFWIGLDIEDGSSWRVSGCVISNVGKYGIRIRHTDLPDGGDQYISDTLFSGGGASRNPDAAIRYESGGGLKLSNIKINGSGTGNYDYGIDLAWSSATASSVLLASNLSIENVDVDGIRGVVSATAFSKVMLSNVQISLFANTTGSAINLSSSGGTLAYVTINGLTATQTGGASTGYVVKLNGVDHVRIAPIVMNGGWAGRLSKTTCSDVIDMSTAEDAWTAYTPTFTNLTIGNGTHASAWKQVGREVHVRIMFTLGSTSAVTGSITATLPVAPVAGVKQGLAGAARDSSVPQVFALDGAIAASGSTVQLMGGAGVVSATTPMTWATGDDFALSGVYEAASV